MEASSGGRSLQLHRRRQRVDAALEWLTLVIIEMMANIDDGI